MPSLEPRFKDIMRIAIFKFPGFLLFAIQFSTKQHSNSEAMSSDIDIPSDTNLANDTVSETEINKNANKTQQQQSNIQQHIQKQANKMKNTARTQRKRNNTGMLNIDSHSQVLRSKWSTKYHIFNDKNTEYSILMNQTDISFGHRGHNKFYAIQLLEHNQGNEYRFVTKWGIISLTTYNIFCTHF